MNKLFIRTDANQNIGMGHIMRCITIAKALKSMQCIFLVSDLKASCIVEANGFELLCLNTDYKSMDIKESDTINSLGYQYGCLLYTSPSPRDRQKSRMPSSA